MFNCQSRPAYQTPTDYLFPISLEHIAPFDKTEALPIADVSFLSKGDIVRYERLNDAGEVIKVNYYAQKAHIRIASTIRFWVDVKSISLLKVAANQAAETCVRARLPGSSPRPT